ncbi:MAG: hypothetical protein KKF16_03525 [Euryarchaeota archaeon]|nr:hypothetical protein [Euryarchaeota archaeon]MBU4548385.1 hypothetical protein [Euryarchaeota archaeon]MBU4607220.1 hypothetical protein [Euryarchaeota archaeon]MBV1755261.1 hypothetical protein [Methanobacterium sp.]MBV1767552.1 hypothetical protein [Methanobacterium sp.]
MYQEGVYLSEVLSRMNHVFERFRHLSRTRSLKKHQIEEIDYHITEITRILNECN